MVLVIFEGAEQGSASKVTGVRCGAAVSFSATERPRISGDEVSASATIGLTSAKCSKKAERRVRIFNLLSIFTPNILPTVLFFSSKPTSIVNSTHVHLLTPCLPSHV